MGKHSFNEMQKQRRAHFQNRKRAIHGDPLTNKLKIKPQTHSLSAKRQRKLLNKWRRDQKEAIEKGLVTMPQDVDMDLDAQSKSKTAKFRFKKIIKTKPTNPKAKKNEPKSSQSQPAPAVDAMVE